MVKSAWMKSRAKKLRRSTSSRRRHRTLVMKNRLRLGLWMSCIFLIPLSLQASTFTIINADSAGVGFNDPTPVAPIGGNTGTTLGQQRLNVFAATAAQWGSVLAGNITIRVNAQ